MELQGSMNTQKVHARLGQGGYQALYSDWSFSECPEHYFHLYAGTLGLYKQGMFLSVSQLLQERNFEIFFSDQRYQDMYVLFQQYKER